MTTDYYANLQTQTAPAAWAASPLARPSLEFSRDMTDTDRVREGAVGHPGRPVLTAALLGGVAITPLLGLAAYLFAGGTTLAPAVLVPSETIAPATPAPPSPVPEHIVTPAPKTVVSVPDRMAEPDSDPMPPGGQQGPAQVPIPGDTVIVDIPIPDYPPLPPKPDDPIPEPPNPDPPVLDDPNFKLPEPHPNPEPNPDPPEFVPDLGLAPVPKPDPAIKLPLIPSPQLNPQPDPPSVGLNPQPEPPSLPNFVPPAGFGS